MEPTSLSELVSRLDSIAADIDDMAFDLLQQAVADREVERPVHDKELMKARRSIEKAAHVLRRLDDQST